jgi:hypothetical protein
MSKQLNQHELAELVTRLLTTRAIKDETDFSYFMSDIADAVGSLVGGVYSPMLPELDEEGEWLAGFAAKGPHEPADPHGFLAQYDPDGELESL